MINLIYDFETRIRILSKSLRAEVDKDEIIKMIKSHAESADPYELDGRTDLSSLMYEEEQEDFLVEGRKGPSTWIGKYLARMFPEKRIHLTWMSIEWKTGSIIYMLSGDELIEDIKRNEY